MASRLYGPTHGHQHQHVTSPETYRQACAKFRGGKTHEATPTEWAQLGFPHVSHGQWFVDCRCGNGASLSPDWHLACCFLCGAIYHGVTMPEDWEAIETVLLARAEPSTRNYHVPETLEMLIAENERHGVPL